MVPNLKEAFHAYEEDFLEFHKVENPFSHRPDLNAFILIDKLLPQKKEHAHNIISAARHKEYYLGVDVDKLALVISNEDVLTLVRCGVRYDSYYDALCLFS